MKRPFYFPKKRNWRQKTIDISGASAGNGTNHTPQNAVFPHRGEQIRTAVYQIAQASNATDNLQELFYSIQRVLGRLMPAQNFFIALYDPATEMVNYPYFVDENDQPPSPQFHYNRS